LEEYYNCVNGDCTSKTDGENNVEYGIYLLNVDGKDTMYKCGHKKCWPEERNGMYVFEIKDSEERVMLDDAKLDALTGITSKKIVMNQCVKGICNPVVKGFIKYGRGSSTVAKYDTTIITTSSFVKCEDSSGGENGLLKSNMDMCINGGLKESKPIVGVGVLYGEPLRLYQRTSYNVIGTVISGNYNFGTSVTVCGSTTASVCGPSTALGYYVNSDTNTNRDYKLIYCRNDGSVKCENTSVVENGYYWKAGDDGTKVIICDNSGCEVTSTSIEVTTDCSTPANVNKNKLVYYGGGFKYCKDTTSSGGVAISSLVTPKYYVVSNNYEPISKFNYPTHFTRLDVPESEIIIKIQPYSVTAIIGDNIPIGYVKAGDSYLECGFNENGKKGCVDADVTGTECTSETVGKLITSGGIKLCVDPSIDPVNVSSGTAEYLIALGNGKFGIGGRNDGKEYFIDVKIADSNVTVVKEPNTIKYRYTGTDAETHRKSLFKIYDKNAASQPEAQAANGICDATASGPGKSFEYEVIEWPVGSGANPAVDYYTPGDNSNL